MKSNTLLEVKPTLSAAQAQAILEVAEDAIISIDASQRIIAFNGSAQRLFGYSREEMLGEPLEILLPEAVRQSHATMIHHFVGAGEPAKRMGERQAVTGIRRDGSEFAAEATICVVGSGPQLVCTAILRDITEQRRIDQELLRAKEAAESADQAKSMFLANMSHEIRTPLNAVIGMTSLLLDTTLSNEQEDCARTIRASSEALLAIINDILDYSKIEVGKLELEHQPFDLRACIEESLDLVSTVAGEKRINLAYLIDDGVPAVVVADVTRLRQILVNLLSNATKFTHQGEVVVSVNNHPLESERHRLEFSVTDTGIGIPADRLDTLFDSFSQVDASTTRKYGGTGLGLAISKRLAKIMGGDMRVESQPGHGSTFFFTIEVGTGGEDLALSYLQEHALELTAKRLLIVDDNMTNRRILVKQALLWGMLPTATASGIEAMDLVRHGHGFDLAILDMSMPEMDGLELARRIREHHDAKSLPLIMLSSMSQRPGADVMDALCFSAYLSKPIKASQLFEVLRTSLGIRNPVTEPARARPAYDATLASRRPLTILVAEDNAINQKVIQRMLAKFGYRCDIAVNGLEVLAALERQHYDLVLMDLQMPEMDGLETMLAIKRRYADADRPRIVAMTANVQTSDRDACLAAGMDGFVAKPVDVQQLQRVLNQGAGSRATTVSALAAHAPDPIDQSRIEMLRAARGSRSDNLLVPREDVLAEELGPDGQRGLVGHVVGHADGPDAIELQQVFDRPELLNQSGSGHRQHISS